VQIAKRRWLLVAGCLGCFELATNFSRAREAASRLATRAVSRMSVTAAVTATAMMAAEAEAE
jgi:hypothetical protein